MAIIDLRVISSQTFYIYIFMSMEFGVILEQTGSSGYLQPGFEL